MGEEAELEAEPVLVTRGVEVGTPELEPMGPAGMEALPVGSGIGSELLSVGSVPVSVGLALLSVGSALLSVGSALLLVVSVGSAELVSPSFSMGGIEMG